MRSIIHLDMDAFYAAVEQRDNPTYAGKPVIVGGDPRRRGVVSTCSYEARKFGVHSAMPLREAARLCPQGIFVPVDMSRYEEVSERIMAIMSSYTPLIEPLSLDEAFLDVTGSQRLFGTAEEIARQIVERIKREEGLSASVGISFNKFLAKLASDLQKPRGFVVISKENIDQILAGLPVNKIWGVGPSTEEHLRRQGFATIGQLQQVPREHLAKILGEVGDHIYLLIHGLDDRPVETAIQAKSISNETTFAEDTADRAFLSRVLLSLSERVARRARQARLKGRTIVLKLRDETFKTLTRNLTLEEPTDFEEVIYNTSVSLAEKTAWGGSKVRLLGVGLTNLIGAGAGQVSLFGGEERERLSKLHAAVDKIKDKYGDGVVKRGRT